MTCLFWKDGEVIEFDVAPSSEWAVESRMLGYPCIDLTFKERQKRYGYFERSENGHWKPTLFADMPAELKMHELLHS